MKRKIQHWWQLQQLRFSRDAPVGEAISFARAVADIRNILLCMPLEWREFRVARYVLKFLPTDEQGYHLIFLTPEEHAEKIPMRPGDAVITLDPSKRPSPVQFPPGIERRVLDLQYDAVVNMNTEFDLGLARLIARTDAPLRIGFGGKYSEYFYNVEIGSTENRFLLEGAYRSIQRLLNLENNS